MKKPYGIILTCLGFVVLFLGTGGLIYIYLNSPNVVRESWGGPAEFGQFGDMIGGILNPVIALISVILLLLTYKQALKNAEIEHRRVEREEIRNVINETKTTINFLKNEKSFIMLVWEVNEKDTSTTYMYFSFQDCFDEKNSYSSVFKRRLQYMQSQSAREYPLDTNDTEFDEIFFNHKEFDISFIHFFAIKSLTLRLLDLQLDYLKTQKSVSLSNLMHSDFINVLYSQFDSFVLTKNEHTRYLQKLDETISTANSSL